ncbi:MAG: hypothetical protein SGJ09_01740 [Phycisphaerae bacterium]|nr:hypothetical protein [Phycisphaerae bacterium]
MPHARVRVEVPKIDVTPVAIIAVVVIDVRVSARPVVRRAPERWCAGPPPSIRTTRLLI